MSQLFESQSHVHPDQVREDVAGRLKEPKGIKSLELLLKGDGMDGAREFGEVLLLLKKRKVRVSHEIAIRLDFPQTISREKALAILETIPTPTNGSLKVRIELNQPAKTPTGI